MKDGYYDLGQHTWQIATDSPEAQVWFDRGLMWSYGFNHEEAVFCFEQAAKADPGCAMAYWGKAWALGPNYNKEWADFDPEDLSRSLEAAQTASSRAVELANGANELENDIVRALVARYESAISLDDLAMCNSNYANEMRQVYRRHGDQLDVAALFADALMNLTPWSLWDVTSGSYREGAPTAEVIQVLEGALAAPEGITHPGILHLYIHLMEMSPDPERALQAADRLRDLVPDAGHLQHMPSHIDVLCGNYAKVVASNNSAIEADRLYLRQRGPLNFYSTYRCHNLHFKLYGAMLMGNLSAALEAADELVATITPDLLAIDVPPMAEWLEGFVGMRTHVLVRFGRWQDLIDMKLPEDADLFLVTSALAHYGKGIAYAATHQIEKAVAQQEKFQAAVSRVPPSRKMFNNTWQDILEIATAMLAGEIEYRLGNHELAFERLRSAIQLEDSLPYDEPWGWMQPSRHAYGALLLEQGHVDMAERVYRADLGIDGSLPRPYQHPNNVWSLHGLHECLQRLDRPDEAAAIGKQLRLAMAHADVQIESSCFCRLHSH